MAKPVKYSQIEAQINLLHNGVSQVASWYRNNSDHYTPEGQQAKYTAAIQDQRHGYQNRAQKLSSLIDQITPAAENKTAQARAALFPVATDPTERLAAEMEAQRLMSRPNMDQPEILNLIINTDPSPGLTLAMQEWQARGQFDEQFLDGALQGKSPEYQEAKRGEGQARQMAGMLRQRLEKTTEQMDTTREVDTEYTPTVGVALAQGWTDDLAVDDVPAGAFDAVSVDPVYRSN